MTVYLNNYFIKSNMIITLTMKKLSILRQMISEYVFKNSIKIFIGYTSKIYLNYKDIEKDGERYTT